ncbi:unnamed protein product [Meganyctiphanes norvegica]|uniref:Uncharacterized protein n=1 Tax=Meganyctiphanes norvegica TaxID=48144 RepID=A0AAV2S4R6_MEGNR
MDDNIGGFDQLMVTPKMLSQPTAVSMHLPHHLQKSATTAAMDEPYLLKRGTHCSSVLEQLLMDETFTDVTLTANGQSIRAHRVVLCLASAYFREVLSHDQNVHSVIIFRDTKLAELKHIIEFIYTGKVAIEASDLESLMITADSLKISSLSGLLPNCKDAPPKASKHRKRSDEQSRCYIPNVSPNAGPCLNKEPLTTESGSVSLLTPVSTRNMEINEKGCGVDQQPNVEVKLEPEFLQDPLEENQGQGSIQPISDSGSTETDFSQTTQSSPPSLKKSNKKTTYLHTSKRSEVWQHFTVLSGTPNITQCNHCHKRYRFKSTSNFLNHLKRVHAPNYRVAPPKASKHRKPSDKQSRCYIPEVSPNAGPCLTKEPLLFESGSISSLTPVSTRDVEIDKEGCGVDLQPDVEIKLETKFLQHPLEENQVQGSIHPILESESTETDVSNLHTSKRSEVWQHFTVLSGTPKMAQCNHCLQSYRYKSSTSNFLNHLKRRHAPLLVDNYMRTAL